MTSKGLGEMFEGDSADTCPEIILCTLAITQIKCEEFSLTPNFYATPVCNGTFQIQNFECNPAIRTLVSTQL